MFHTHGHLFKNAFGTPEIREVFTEEAYVDRFMRVEAALARAQADIGVIPEAAAEEITNTASVEHIDLEDVERRIEEIDLFTVAIIQTWKEEIGDHGEYIHWGATSQDIADMALLELIREGLSVLETDIEAVGDALEILAETHAETPMVGRTHHVHALPITFGLKAANWLDEFTRDRDRLESAVERVEALQFFGAVGTLASLGEDALEVQERFAEELELTVPATAWHSSRDRFVELANAFASMGATLGRIARQVLVLGREEIGELAEPIDDGQVGSSTMPHKRNPIKTERNLGLAALLRGHASTMQTLNDGHDERDAGLWYAEYALIPEAFCYLSRALRNSREVLTELVVDAEAMQENLEHHDGLVTSEALMMALADTVGRQTAHELVYDAVTKCLESDKTFLRTLLDDEQITAVLSSDEIERLTDPTAYTGSADVFSQRAIENSRQQ
ncbi:adenylosuccinate lyase [Natronorubrum sp. FCH18a]|uniref:adenylosuccinate lyase n=1 Tax=Natronorubrum sp. FCH18a TaxID=3447018 RepID=UPI003F51020D